MRKHGPFFVLMACLLCLNQNLFSQIVQGAGTLHLCAPTPVTYTAPAGATNISWNFGSFGTSTSASGLVTNAGTAQTITASFSGMVSGNPVTFTVIVYVHNKPVANFSISQPVLPCIVKTVTLTDLSTSSSGIASWNWIYGDGGSSANSASVHTYNYTLPGTYSITLKVTDIYGCDHQVTLGSINTVSPPQAVIVSNPANLVSCGSSMVASFSASNSVGSGLTYNWNYGSGSSQSQNVGPITFPAQANPYIISLTVSANGCTSSTSVMAVVTAPTLSVTIPSTVCLNKPFVATVISNQPTSFWNFGTTTTVYPTPPAPLYTVVVPPYTSYGVKTINITAGSAPCITPVMTKTLLVEQVTSSFVAAPPAYTSCSSPVIGSFTSQSSSNVTMYYWSYTTWQNGIAGNQGPNLTTITFTFSQQSNNPYTVYSAWTPLVTLDVKTAVGCWASSNMPYHTVMRPTAVYSKNKKEGCVPLAVTFTNTSSTFIWDPLTSYTWCNGASPPVYISGTVSPTPPPIPVQTFTYSTVGHYYPYLIIKTQHGCVDTTYHDTIRVVNPPTVSFNFTPTSVCWNQPVQIVNTTASSATVQHWHVSSDNGFFSGCVSDPNPSWNFTHVGTHSVQLSGYQNGCMGTSVSSQSVQVKGPIVSGRFQTNCDVNRKSVKFYSYLQECQYAVLNFGDGPSSYTITGNANSNVSDSTTHIYSSTGDYTVTLRGYNTASGCTSHSVSMVVHVRDVLASFAFPQPTVCVNVSSSYNAVGTVDAYQPRCALWKYLWYFDNLPPAPSVGPLMYHAFNTVGTHSVSLYVKDENSCTSTLTKTIGVSGPVIQFSANPNPMCASNGTVQFVNNTSNLPDPITGYYWNFGNGNSLATTASTVPLQTYSNAVTPFSNYTIALTATNSIGCIDTKTLLLQVNKPDASFYASQQNICLSGNNSANITFSAVVSYPSYTYDYGTPVNPTLATSSNITTHSFGVGTFTVKVTVKDNMGCQNTSSVIINAAQTPTADFTYLSNPPALKPNAICAPATMTFINITSPQSNTYTPNWDLGGGFGQVVSQNTVSNSYSSPSNTVIPISLMVTTGPPNYCQSTVTKNFNLYVVKAKVSLTNSIVCLGGSIKFSIDTTQGAGVLAWVWDFGDLSQSPTVTAFPTPPASTLHVYSTYPASTAGSTTVSLIYYSSDYACAYYDGKPIQIIKVDAGFKRNNEAQRIDSVHCLKVPDTFKNVSFAGNPLSLSYNWEFPGGSAATGTAPAFTFPKPGVFQVTLTVTDNSNNCTGKAVRNMTILPLPTASISTGLYCPDKPFPITASLSPGAVSGTWTPASGIVGVPTFTTLTGTFTSTGTISKSASYYLNVTDTSNCVSDTVKMMINILPPPPVVRWDTTVIIGQPIPINGNVGNFTYTWSPVTTDLSCTLCPNPVSTSTVNITYSVNVEDLQKCAVVTSTYNVIIEPKTSVDVPTAFTPNGDGTNDLIYVGGWGIRKLNYFRIYNRWGQLLFETSDIKTGWDGTFQGVPQNMETYVYQVSVETLVEGRILDKTATFKLLR